MIELYWQDECEVTMASPSREDSWYLFLLCLWDLSHGLFVSRRGTGLWDRPGSSGAWQAAPLYESCRHGRVGAGAALPAGCLQAHIWEEIVPTCEWVTKERCYWSICWHLVDRCWNAAWVNSLPFCVIHVGSCSSLDRRVSSPDRTDPPADSTGCSCTGYSGQPGCSQTGTYVNSCTVFQISIQSILYSDCSKLLYKVPSAHQVQFGVQYLAQGHFDMQLSQDLHKRSSNH